MTDKFIRLRADEGQHFYVKTTSIDAIGPDPDDPDCTVLVVAGQEIVCYDTAESIIAALWVDVAEVADSLAEQKAVA